MVITQDLNPILFPVAEKKHIASIMRAQLELGSDHGYQSWDLFPKVSVTAGKNDRISIREETANHSGFNTRRNARSVSGWKWSGIYT